MHGIAMLLWLVDVMRDKLVDVIHDKFWRGFVL